MTLPTQPLRGDKPAGARAGRRSACLSAAWPDRRSIGAATRDRRRAVCSWSAGYGTLTETSAVEDTLTAAARCYDRDTTVFKKGKVADQAALLETRSRRIVTTTSASTVAIPHAPPLAATTAPTHQAPPVRRQSTRAEPLLAMPGIKSILSGGRRRDSQAETRSPLVKRKGGAEHVAAVKPAASLASLRKCETVLALTGYLRSSSSSSSIEPLQPVNRLRVTPDPTRSRTCSRCSSLLTLASGSRYSLCSSAGGFVPVTGVGTSPGGPKDETDAGSPQDTILCKLCLQEAESIMRIRACGCAFCHECMKAYVEFEISEGAYDISCPDAQCSSQGVLQLEEIKRLAGSDLLEKHKKYRLNREVELDKTRTWCPRAGCETVCNMCPTQKCSPQSVYCPTCTSDFCSNCKLEWHEGMSCDEYSIKLTKEGKSEEPGIPFDSDLIKCCPMCNVPIEKDEGCAQMMCKRCKHVFCWYCLASLDDDFLLRHYDKGPCKNKLGHSRASVIWHRTQVIGIFAGFGILLLVASPLLLLAAPCIVCCKCRFCNTGTTKLDNEDEALGEES